MGIGRRIRWRFNGIWGRIRCNFTGKLSCCCIRSDFSRRIGDLQIGRFAVDCRSGDAVTTAGGAASSDERKRYKPMKFKGIPPPNAKSGELGGEFDARACAETAVEVMEKSSFWQGGQRIA